MEATTLFTKLDETLLSKGATLRQLAAPGGQSEALIRAPPAEEHKSKRYDGITSYATELDDDADVLDDQTRAKNREFERRLVGLTFGFMVALALAQWSQACWRHAHRPMSEHWTMLTTLYSYVCVAELCFCVAWAGGTPCAFR